jgi:hypothetical protein
MIRLALTVVLVAAITSVLMVAAWLTIAVLAVFVALSLFGVLLRPVTARLEAARRRGGKTWT